MKSVTGAAEERVNLRPRQLSIHGERTDFSEHAPYFAVCPREENEVQRKYSMTEANALTADLVECARTKFAESVQQIERCLNLLSVEQVWHRPNEVSNSIGNLVIHLNGNVRQWIVAGLGGEEFARDRPAEFAQREAIPTDKILGELKTTIEHARAVIADLSPERLLQKVTIQDYEVTGLAAVVHVVEHFSLHTGQIVYATKILINRDLSLYDSQGHRIDGRQAGTP